MIIKFVDAFGIRVFYNKKLQAERIDVDFIEEGSQVLSERISIIADYNSVCPLLAMLISVGTTLHCCL